MTPRSFELRESFHLAFLRHLATRLFGRSYAVKGGICLRFFHRSPRLSQDLDLDISPEVRLKTLQNAVDSVLGGQAERTQRWARGGAWSWGPPSAG